MAYTIETKIIFSFTPQKILSYPVELITHRLETASVGECLF